MTTTPTAAHQTAAPSHFGPDDVRLEDFVALVDRTTDRADYPLAAEVVDGVVGYDGPTLLGAAADAAGRAAVTTELVHALTDGPGVVLVRHAFPDTAPVDRVSAVFDAIIAEQRAAGGAVSDHFAAAGANDRVWNALEKLALRDPDAFVDYYGNELVALISTAWLGPGYQVTSQVNVVRPGGVAQDPHRDYHLGFLPDELARRYPVHAHLLSPALTLQGAVAHTDMPVDSGPTMYLPYSHHYAPGYLAWRRPEFRAWFADHHVQVALRKGDAAFFNPAVFHGAGSNVSADVQRSANLLQVSSAFGRAMEAVDRVAISRAVYPALRQRHRDGAPAGFVAAAVACVADGYPFPTDLDRDPNVGGLMPLSHEQIVHRALVEDWDPARLDGELDAYVARRSPR